jgi:hypothetical protein
MLSDWASGLMVTLCQQVHAEAGDSLSVRKTRSRARRCVATGGHSASRAGGLPSGQQGTTIAPRLQRP